MGPIHRFRQNRILRRRQSSVLLHARLVPTQTRRSTMTVRPTAGTPAASRPRAERNRVLVVGRDPGVTAVIAVGLRPRFETEADITATEALAQVRGRPLGLIVAEIAQGDLDAAFSIRALAARSPNCQIIAIGSTEDARIADRLAGLDVHGFFPRPIDFGALVARVSSLSRSADDNSPDPERSHSVAAARRSSPTSARTMPSPSVSTRWLTPSVFLRVAWLARSCTIPRGA